MAKKIISLADRLRERDGERRTPSADQLAESTGQTAQRKLANGLQYPREVLGRMAEVLSDDTDLRDTLVAHILSAYERLPKEDQREFEAYVQQVLDQHRKSQNDR